MENIGGYIRRAVVNGRIQGAKIKNSADILKVFVISKRAIPWWPESRFETKYPAVFRTTVRNVVWDKILGEHLTEVIQNFKKKHGVKQYYS